MTKMVVFAACVAGAILLSALIRRNLGQRRKARVYRECFVRIAEELISDEGLPDVFAAQLVKFARLPLGLATQVMVVTTFWRALTGHVMKANEETKIELVPSQLQERYVHAVLFFVLADSYFSLFMGPLYRAMNSWLFDAVREVHPDVRSHATQNVVASVSALKGTVFSRSDDLAVCA